MTDLKITIEKMPKNHTCMLTYNTLEIGDIFPPINHVSVFIIVLTVHFNSKTVFNIHMCHSRPNKLNDLKQVELLITNLWKHTDDTLSGEV